MGYTSTGGTKARGSFNNTPSTEADFDKLLELLCIYANHLGGISESERDALTGDALYAGLSCFNTDEGTLEVYDGSGWEVVWAPATSPGSVVPTAGSGVSLSSNAIYSRNGWLLGTIGWSLDSGTLSHGQTILTLPVGARPEHEYHAMVSAAPSPSSLFQLIVETGGAVKANQPVSGRTSGTVTFLMPIPL